MSGETSGVADDICNREWVMEAFPHLRAKVSRQTAGTISEPKTLVVCQIEDMSAVENANEDHSIRWGERSCHGVP